MATIRTKPDGLTLHVRASQPFSPLSAKVAGAMREAARREIELAEKATPVRKLAIERIHKCRLCTLVWESHEPEQHAPECPARPQKED